MTRGSLWDKECILAPGSRGRVYSGGGGRSAGSQTRRLRNHISKELEMTKGYKPSEPQGITSSSRAHLQGFYNLPKQRHLLGTMCSNTQASGRHFSFTPSQGLRSEAEKQGKAAHSLSSRRNRQDKPGILITGSETGSRQSHTCVSKLLLPKVLGLPQSYQRLVKLVFFGR